MKPHFLLSSPARRLWRLLALTAAQSTLWLPTAYAQTSEAVRTGTPLSSLATLLSVVAFGCLIVGLFKPSAFTFLFKARSTRGVVAATFGGLWFLLVIVGTSTTQVVREETPAAAAAESAAVDKAPTKPKPKPTASAAKKQPDQAKGKAPAKATDEPAVIVEDEMSTNEPENEPQLAENVVVEDLPGIGKREVGKVDDVYYAILSVEKTPTLGNEFHNVSADGMFYVLRLRAYNTDKKTHHLNPSLIKLLDDQEREFEQSSRGRGVLLMQREPGVEFDNAIQPDVGKELTLVYDAPADATGLRVKIPAGSFSLSPDAILNAPKE